MRTLITILIVLFILPQTKAQINLVPNPSFEDTISCPSFLDNMQDVQDWSSYGNSADYFNGCNSTAMNVPNNSFGYQLSHSGSAYCGVITYLKGTSPLGNNYREFVGVQLLSPLQIGTRYYFSFYAVSAQYSNIGFFSNNIGLRFFTTPFSKLNPAPVNNFAHIKLDTLLTDTVNWHKLSGSFIADSNYQYVSIGNFFDYLNTDTLMYITFPECAYSYIDDVCVTTDSIFNEIWTGMKIVVQNEINIWPNPASDFLQFQTINLIEEVLIFDSRSRLIKSVQINAFEGRIDLKELVEGIYFASFRSEKTISVHKFLKL
ncbi:MAG: T9SS type A sorting domain-containing protein [Bacteroidetes bacterium]|nr:T9SS type A sorting domain-containing protein [Bacteroidota bacterium]MBL0097061.1 T9SS type A sorting domain-containing protein [Bacteroidota bacterium]